MRVLRGSYASDAQEQLRVLDDSLEEALGWVPHAVWVKFIAGPGYLDWLHAVETKSKAGGVVYARPRLLLGAKA